MRTRAAVGQRTGLASRAGFLSGWTMPYSPRIGTANRPDKTREDTRMSKHKFDLPKGTPEPEGSGLIEENDVEGHGLPTTAPPSFGRRTPGHGGENIPMPNDDDNDDVEGHRIPRI
jgi:hypothetical protein